MICKPRAKSMAVSSIQYSPGVPSVWKSAYLLCLKKKKKNLTGLIFEILSFTHSYINDLSLSPLHIASHAFLEHEVLSTSYVSGQLGTNNSIALDLQSRQHGWLAWLLLLSLCGSPVTTSVFRVPSIFSPTQLAHRMLCTPHFCCIISVLTIFIMFFFSSWVH